MEKPGQTNSHLHNLLATIGGFFRAESHSEKISFIHIPKTAGTSLRQLVEAEYPKEKCLRIYDPRPEVLASQTKEIQKARALYGHFYYGIHQQLGVQARYVTFVRNPIDRIISFYQYQFGHSDSSYFKHVN
ncbi:MAG: sulfotransferase family 2 domain-containing protein [Gammaproteobacteria bacterium]|jgi:hypothetical protein|nr:hypothetical protein [Gammaproteobacteria bacterium]MDP6097562.1 sulfotransferase family 2 domain-containing protein [Gammaproteobacteria bacterium]HJO12090.1 sulfotransferase family 2 domain-containing protein [Gammaproteobacteria bacterium]|tara:strand:+ start:1009 stop:1401 length:393 start_codon:yes stop_codon:yes gene_type:complete